MGDFSYYFKIEWTAWDPNTLMASYKLTCILDRALDEEVRIRFSPLQNDDLTIDEYDPFIVLTLSPGETKKSMVFTFQSKTPEPSFGIEGSAPLTDTLEGYYDEASNIYDIDEVKLSTVIVKCRVYDNGTELRLSPTFILSTPIASEGFQINFGTGLSNWMTVEGAVGETELSPRDTLYFGDDYTLDLFTVEIPDGSYEYDREDSSIWIEDNNWYTLSARHYTGDATILIDAAKNPYYIERRGLITATTVGGVEKAVNLVQKEYVRTIDATFTTPPDVTVYTTAYTTNAQVLSNTIISLKDFSESSVSFTLTGISTSLGIPIEFSAASIIDSRPANVSMNTPVTVNSSTFPLSVEIKPFSHEEDWDSLPANGTVTVECLLEKEGYQPCRLSIVYNIMVIAPIIVPVVVTTTDEDDDLMRFVIASSIALPFNVDFVINYNSYDYGIGEIEVTHDSGTRLTTSGDVPIAGQWYIKSVSPEVKNNYVLEIETRL